MRYVQVNTGKGEVEPRISNLPMDADLPGPLGNKVLHACLAYYLLLVTINPL